MRKATLALATATLLAAGEQRFLVDVDILKVRSGGGLDAPVAGYYQRGETDLARGETVGNTGLIWVATPRGYVARARLPRRCWANRRETGCCWPGRFPILLIETHP